MISAGAQFVASRWPRSLTKRWVLAFAAAFAAILVLRLTALDAAPPGLHSDEAAFGYNAWTIAHYGVDQYSRPWPLFFQSFGDYKSPVYVYLLAPLTLMMPLTPAVERLPAAFAGIAVCLLAAVLAFSLTRSLLVSWLMMITAAIQPWIVIESRSGWAAILEILALSGVCLCLARARGSRQTEWFFAAGFALAVSLYAYDTGRLLAALVAVLVVFAYVTVRPRQLASLAILPPVLLAYVVLIRWAIQNPGALTARFHQISVVFDNPSSLEAIRRLLQNYSEYIGVPFLFTHGDTHLRHGTAFAGVLLVTIAPVIFVGLLAALRSLHQPLSRFSLLALAAAPLPAALTVDNSPDAPRANAMMAFLLLLLVWGWSAMWPWLVRHRLVLAAFFVAIAIEAGGYFVDLYTQWPSRALTQWDSGQADAVAEAHNLAGGHKVWLSRSLDDPDIFAYFRLTPNPTLTQPLTAEMLGMELRYPQQMAASASPGDILVLAPADTPPEGATLLDRKEVSVKPELVDYSRPTSQIVVLATIWKR